MPVLTETILLVTFGLIMLPGLFMVFIPFMPAMPYLLLAAAAFGIITGFVKFTLIELSILGGIWLLSVLVDFSAGILGAKYGGASRKAFFYGIVGALIGIVFLPFGPIFGLAGGVLVGELVSRKNTNQALKAASGTFLGAAAGLAINIALAFIFLILFFIFAITL